MRVFVLQAGKGSFRSTPEIAEWLALSLEALHCRERSDARPRLTDLALTGLAANPIAGLGG